MIRGRDVWQARYITGMDDVSLGGRTIFTYKQMPNNYYDMLINTVGRFPDKPAFFDNWNRKYTYSEFLEMVDELSDYLEYMYKVKRGTHVGLLLHNSIEFCTAFFAICRLGAVAVPFPTKYRKPEVRALIEKSDLSLLLASESFEGWADDLGFKILYSKDEENSYGYRHLQKTGYHSESHGGTLMDEVIIMFTSGTTSISKGVVLKNYNIMHAAITYQRILEITPEDKTIIPVPIYHITGLIALLGLFVYAGGTVYLYRRYDAERILECIVSNKITFMHGSPTVYGLLLEHCSDYPELTSIRRLACGGSYIPVKIIKKLHDWMPNMKFQTVFGMTETASPGTIFPYDAATSIYPESSGKPIPGLELKIVDEEQKEVPPGVVGSVLIRGANITEYYYKLDTDLISEDGWLDTGDMGYYNEDSYVFFVDRKKDMINRGGEKIWCIDVEENITDIPGVKAAAVVGIPNEKYGEVAAALVVLERGINMNEQQIKDILKDELAHYKIPEKIRFTSEIPKTPGMKIDKKQIKAMF